MEKFGRSQPVKRVEDVRFLTGQGRYVDDIAPANALHAYFLRSTVAHGTLAPLDLEEARAMPGVALVLAAEDLEAAGMPLHLRSDLLKLPGGGTGAAPMRPMLAKDRVRYVGEPIVAIFAETLEQAKDAAEVIMVDIDDLPPAMALEIGGAAIHPEAPDNLVYDWDMGDKSAAEAAIAGAAHVVRVQVPDNRVICNSMEPRGCYAEMEGDRIHVAVNGQGVWGTKKDVAHYLGLDRAQVRVTNPDTGGGFGMKGMRYNETFPVAHAARVLGLSLIHISEPTRPY